MFSSETFAIEDIYKYYPTFDDFTIKSDFLYSPLQLPLNHKLSVKFKNTPNIQVAMGFNNTNNDWVYAQNIGINNNQINYKNNNNQVQWESLPNMTINKDIVYSIELQGNTLKIYQDDTLITTKTTYNHYQSLTALLRLYNRSNISNIEYIKIREL